MQISRDKIIVLTPAIFDNLDPIWMLTHTANRFHVPLRPYGCEPGAVYKGWVDMKVHRLLAECEKALANGYTHVLYMDGRDTMWVGEFDEVLRKYDEVYDNACMVMSTQPTVFESYREYYNLELYPTREELGHPFVYPASPLFMGEAAYIGGCLKWMLENWKYSDGVVRMPDDDPAWWRRFDSECRDELSSGRIVYDHNCEIFQNAGEPVDGKSQWDGVLYIGVRDTNAHVMRVHNTMTNAWPCILHFDGGYSHALYGKWDRLEAFWNVFGHMDVRPPWEV